VAAWDVFHSDRLEHERGLSEEAIRLALARGEIRGDDLVRPAGTTAPWAQLADFPELMAHPAVSPATGSPDSPSAQAQIESSGQLPDFEEVQPGFDQIVPPPKLHHPTEIPGSSSPSDVAFPVFEPEPRLQPPSELTAQPPHSSAAWTWADDDQDDDEDEEEERDRDLGDLEVIADERDFEDLRPATASKERESQPETASEAGRGSHRASHRAEHDAEVAATDHWEPTGEDLDLDTSSASRSSHVALPVVRSRDRDGSTSPGDDASEEDDAFSLSRSATTRIEELDLAPMVDVAFNLVLFFMVTATTVLYKTLEIPKPSGEAPTGAVAQGRSRSLDDLKDDYILVEIDDQGAMKLDREPIEPAMSTLVEQLRRAREKTGRKTMLVSADFTTPHRNAVLAYDAANEIGLGIAIAKPQSPQGPAPTLRGALPAAKPASIPPS
jgi:biopolymer transport protein ExbD